MKTLLNRIIDFFFEKKRTKKPYRPLTNQKLIDGLANGKLFVACIVSRNNNIVSKAITKLSGPFSHVTAAWNSLNSGGIGGKHANGLVKKMLDYYSGTTYIYCPQIIVLASADDNGMNYFSIAEYQNREMIIFEIPDNPITSMIWATYKNGEIGINITTKQHPADDIITEFLSEKVMNANYDYTGLVGQIFRKLGKWFYSLFDDERAYYCSEQAEIFRRHGVKIADNYEPTPTEIYRYCKKHYQVVYSSISKEY